MTYMDAIGELLDKAKSSCSAKTDAELAKRLGITRQSLSAWRQGRAAPDIMPCAKIAEITGIPLARVLGIVGEARAISREEKAVWRRLASAAIVVLSLLPMVPVSATVRPALTDSSYMHYAKYAKCIITTAARPTSFHRPHLIPPVPLHAS